MENGLRWSGIFPWALTNVQYIVMFIMAEQKNIMNIKEWSISMTRNDKEIEILNEALDMFRRTTGLTVEVVGFTNREPFDNFVQDATINIKWEDRNLRFAVEIKNVVNEAILAGVVHQMGLLKQKGLLVAKYINPQTADRLQKLDIQFIDTAGNAYINQPPLYVYIKGNRAIKKPRIEQPNRLFYAGGLQVIFTLLCHPGLENEPYREIADKAGVALGTAGGVMADLREFDYLISRQKKERRLIRKNDLMKKWIEAYPERLRQKKAFGRYKAEKMDWWLTADFAETEAMWGGEVAASKITEYLKPQNFTIYARPPIGRFILKNRLKKDENGDIEILRMFWRFDKNDSRKKLVPPLLIYTDLLATGDERNIETARIIYEQELYQYFREN